MGQHGTPPASRLQQHAASRRHPLLTTVAQQRAQEAAYQLRALLSSASAPALLDPAGHMRWPPAIASASLAADPIAKKVPPPFSSSPRQRPTSLPPLDTSPRLPLPATSWPAATAAAPSATMISSPAPAASPDPTPTALSSQRPAISRRRSFSKKRDASWHVMQEDELSDAEEYRFYTACHWPFYVWKRLMRQHTSALHRLTSSTADGLARMRCIRRWRIAGAVFAKERALRRRMRAVQQRRWMVLLLDRLRQLAASRHKDTAIQRSRKFIRLRTRVVCSASLCALHAYAVCRRQVRRRAFGENMVLNRWGQAASSRPVHRS